VEVPVSAMVVLAVGSHAQAGLGRVYETLIGAAVGVAVSMLTPPVYVQPAGDAIAALARQVSGVLRTAAGDLRQGWTHERAVAALQRARALEDAVRVARDALTRAEDSLRLNPRRYRTAHLPPALRSGLTALEYAAINVRVICRSLADRVEGVPPEELPGPRLRGPVAGVLAAVAEAVTAFGELVGSDVAEPVPDDDRLRRALRLARSRRDKAGRAMHEDADRRSDAWPDYGALLAFVDRLLVDLDPDAPIADLAVHRAVPPSLPEAARAGLSRRYPRRRRP
jgi:hypothetical protein